MINTFLLAVIFSISTSLTLNGNEKKRKTLFDSNLEYKDYTPQSTDIVISRFDYHNKLHGFWLGQLIANWTGLVTEMDKIGNIGEIKTGKFYTRADWGKPDLPSIWGEGNPSNLSKTIDFVFKNEFRLLAVDPSTRGQGIGKLLTLECIAKARQDGNKHVIIHTTKSMQIAWKMYETLGFKRAKDLDFMQEELPVFGFRLVL